MNKYRNINYGVLPDFIVEFLHYRLYCENLSQFTVYGEAERLKSFLRYLICLNEKIDLKDFNKIHDFKCVKIRWLSKLKLEDMLKYIEFITNNLSYGAQTRANTVLTVKTLYRYLHKIFKYLKENKFEDLKVPRYKLKTVVYMQPDECIKFFDVIDNPRDKAIIYLLLNTGARRCEVANALLVNLDFKSRTLLVTGKGNKDRFLYLNDKALEALQEYLNTRTDNCPYLFVTKNLNKIDYNDVYRTVKRNLEKAGLDSHKYSTHKLRHTFATLLYQNGTDLRLLQELLGHANLDTTMRYTHLQDNILSSAVDNYILNKKVG